MADEIIKGYKEGIALKIFCQKKRYSVILLVISVTVSQSITYTLKLSGFMFVLYLELTHFILNSFFGKVIETICVYQESSSYFFLYDCYLDLW